MCDVRLVMNLHFLFLWYIHKILVKYMKGEKKKKKVVCHLIYYRNGKVGIC